MVNSAYVGSRRSIYGSLALHRGHLRERPYGYVGARDRVECDAALYEMRRTEPRCLSAMRLQHSRVAFASCGEVPSAKQLRRMRSAVSMATRGSESATVGSGNAVASGRFVACAESPQSVREQQDHAMAKTIPIVCGGYCTNHLSGAAREVGLWRQVAD